MEHRSNMVYNQKLNQRLKCRAKDIAEKILQLNENQLELEEASSKNISRIIQKIVSNERK